jgi:gamma-glutamyltranspeptidase/glutathione hydrolase
LDSAENLNVVNTKAQRMNVKTPCFKVYFVMILMLSVIAAPAWADGDALVRPVKKQVQVTTGQGGMVVSETLESSRIGAQILRQGGNAVDATVAVAFALAVTWPEAGNIAGGGFMMVSMPQDPQVWCVEYREAAPAAATPEMFVHNPSRFTWQQVGVPGTVAGLYLAHQKWGKLPWKTVVMPAAELAKDGFTVDAHLANSLNDVLTRKNVQTDDTFAELRRVYGKPDGTPWQGGDRLAVPDLSRTITDLAQHGPTAFYQGSVGKQLIQAMQDSGGIMTMQDLANYQAKLRPPIHMTFHGYDIYGPPLPSAGGYTLAMMLNQLEVLPLDQYSRFDAQVTHLIAEAQRRAYHQRAMYLGDADFVKIPGKLLDKTFANTLAQSVDPMHATPSDSLAPAPKLADESPDTTHFSIIDADGMAVSNTYTLEKSWGTRLIVPNTGMILNNEMGDFNPIPGHTDRKGKIGTDPNCIQPGKRMLSSQTPVIVRQQGKTVMVVGSPGGRTITNTVLNVLLNRIVFHMSMDQAVQLPRQHHQWFPDRIQFEYADDPAYESMVNQLRHMGHVVIGASSQGQGSAHSIDIDLKTGLRIGVADWRRGGAAVAQ